MRFELMRVSPVEKLKEKFNEKLIELKSTALDHSATLAIFIINRR